VAEKTLDDLKREAEGLSEIADKMSEDLKETEKSAKSMVNSVLSFGEKLLGSFSEANVLAAEQLETQEDIFEAQKMTNEAKQRAIQAQIEYNKAQGKSTSQQEKQSKNLKDQNEKLDARQKKVDKQTRSAQAQNNVYQSSSDIFGSIAIKLGISRSESAGMAKNMFSSWRSAVKQDGIIKGTLKSIVSMGKALWDAFSPVSMISSAMSAIFKASIEFLFRSSEAISNFSAAAGDAGAMARDVGAAMSLGTGVNIEQAAQAASGLAASWQGFASASREARVSMIRTAAELERLGIGAQETGASVNLLTKGMGMSTKQAEDTMKGMASAAMSLGTTPAKLASDFASVSSSLALYGSRMIDEFYDLAAAAKASGLEIQELASLGESFDSFDAASAKAGNLNALLGGPFVDSMEMMRLQAEEGPDAVAAALKDAFSSAGKTFEDMNYMERKSYAETLGMSADKFAKLMGYESDEAKAAAKAAKRDANTQKRYQSMLRSTLSLGEQIRNFFQSVFVKGGVAKAISNLIKVLMKSQKGAKSITDMIAGPMVSAIEWVTDVVGELVSRFDKELAPALTKVGNAFIALFSDPAKEAGEAGKSFATTAVDGIVKFLGSLTEGLKKMDDWYDKGKTFFGAIGVMVAEVMEPVVKWFKDWGIWIGLGALAIAALSIVIMYFVQTTGWMMLAVLGLLTISLLSLSEVLKQTAAAFESFGDIFTKMGDGIATVGKVIGELFQMFRASSGGDALKFLGWLSGIASAIEDLTDAADDIDEKKFNYLGQLMRSIRDYGNSAAMAVRDLNGTLLVLGNTLTKFPADKFGAFSWNLTRTLEATAQVTPASARGAVQVIEEAKEYQKEVVKNKDNVDALAEILKATGAAQPAGGPGGETIIRLEIGGKVLNDYIWNSVNGTINRRR
tara:strand:+ start:35100 stop:37820 length:2721 start_codon:yes stop_codon:yes gene_type:complete